MKVSEILKDLDDISIVDDITLGKNGFDGRSVGLETVELEDPDEVENSNDDGSDSENAYMVNPLQQKHEMIKKEAGVENDADYFVDQSKKAGKDMGNLKSRTKEGQSEAEDLVDKDLNQMKKNAGVSNDESNFKKKDSEEEDTDKKDDE